MALAKDKTGYDEALHKPRLCKDCGSFVFLLRPTAAASKHREAKCYDCVKKTEAKRLADRRAKDAVVQAAAPSVRATHGQQ